MCRGKSRSMGLSLIQQTWLDMPLETDSSGVERGPIHTKLVLAANLKAVLALLCRD
jgi:hypothetical protein